MMAIERNLYFAAYCIERGIAYTVDQGKVSLELSPLERSQLMTEYERTHRDYFNTVRLLIRKLQRDRTTAKPVVKSKISW